MKAIILKHPGGINNLVETEVPKPIIEDHEVLVQVKAISINPVDAVVRSNEKFLNFVLELKPGEQPIILGWDISGVITKVGKSVTKFKISDKVFGMVNFTGHGKAYAEYVAASENHLAIKPDNITYAEAAAATSDALTAWQVSVTYGKLKQDEKVLIHSAAGGVGHYAIQIAKYLGANVIGTGSAVNNDFIKEMGADEVIDYKNQTFEQLVTDADLVVDAVSFTTEHIYRSINALKKGGRLISLTANFDEEFNKVLENSGIYGHRLSVVSSGEDMKSIA